MVSLFSKFVFAGERICSKGVYFISCIAFLCGITSFYVFAEQTERFPNWLFHFRGLSRPFPIEASLKGNEVDMSSVLSALERVTKSPYDYISEIDFIVSEVSETISLLCGKSQLPETCKEKANTELQKTQNKIYQALENQILYPLDHQPIGEASAPRSLKQSMDALDFDCLEKCNNSGLINVLRYSSSADYSQLYDKIKSQNGTCQKNILDALTKELEYEEFPKRCLEEENKNHPVCKSMLKDINIVRDRVFDIVELAYGPETLKTTEAAAPCLDCMSKDRGENESVNLFSDLIANIQKQIQCHKLKPGQEKRVYSGTERDDSYNMKKESDGTYSVSLNLKFSADEDYDGNVPKDQVPAHYMKWVQKCMDKANQKMLGPNGEQLKIVIKSPQKQDPRCRDIDTKEIAIGSIDHRSNSGKYKADIDCPTITHEILHLLGLCDEYEERSRGYYVDAKTGKVEGYTQSVFNEKDETNQKFKNKEGYQFKPAYDCRVTITNSIMSNQYKRWDNVFRDGKNDSLLNPGQFNAILYGSCSEKNKTFNECSQLAYKSSVTEKDCMEKKQQCEEQNDLGMNRGEEIERIKKEIERLEGHLAQYEKPYNKGSYPDKITKRLPRLREELKAVESWPDTNE
ncbi:MAG: hypothetical protein F4X95_00395 [Oligoflexia bacterium]|nr:hypothetical protein [Oligoflexia bacterium]